MNSNRFRSSWVDLRQMWLVETEILLLSKSNTLWDNRRATCGENAMRIFNFFLTKIEIAVSLWSDLL